MVLGGCATVPPTAPTDTATGAATSGSPVQDTAADAKGTGPKPKITVFTEFPTGEVTDPAVDITYEAVASKGATVTEVY
jgi:hypothetical protein